MIEFRRIDHVQLPIPPDSGVEADGFYVDVLGLERVEKPASLREHEGRWYRGGGVELHLGVGEPTGPTRRHPALEVADLAAARETIESVGVEIREGTHIPGRERFFVEDPFGNRLELLAYE